MFWKGNKMRKILENYKDRIPVLSAYYFLSNIFKNKVKFTQISDEEFFNIVIQLLLFMLDKTIKKEICFKEDLTSCIENINSQTYKKWRFYWFS